MRIAIVGSRDYTALERVVEYVESLPLDTVIISGGARGVDSTAENWAWGRGMQVISFPADWKRYGKSAGYRRNIEIVEACDEVVAFWDGKSSGTKHTIKLAKQAGKPVTVFTPMGGG